ncbi:microcin H47 secretion ATP-binding protein [Erwinia tracheiphila PSU-1]|nr:microcin H47 secretion ATP-binding protein [Erwinia tracheiphila PSU-1]
MENKDPMSWITDRLDLSFRRRFPLILQTESAECGLACLAMIIRWFGQNTDLLSLRHAHGISSRGATLAELMNIASRIGMATRPLSLDLDELPEIRLPCILHWDFSHFVVLVKVNKERCVIHDPALGRRVIGRRELSEHFTGVALEIWPDADFTQVGQRTRLHTARLARNIVGLRASLTVIFSLSLMIEFIGLLLPVGTQMVMDHAVPADDRGLLMIICLGLLLLTLLQAGLNVLRNWTSLIMNTMTDIQWKDGLFRHLLRLPLIWFEKRQTGDIQSRFSSLDAIRTTFTRNITGALTDGIMSVGALVLLCLYGGWLAAVVVAITALYVLIRLLVYPVYRQTSEELLVKNGRAASSFTETLFGMATVRAQGLSERRRQNWLSQVSDSVNTGFKLARFDMFFDVLSAFISACDNVLILWLGISRVMDNQMTVGAFVAFSAFRGLFSDRILSLTGLFAQLRMLSIHNERIADIALSEAEPENSLKPPLAGDGALSLRAEALSFCYDAQSPAVFSGLNMHIRAGESVAITGPSGCGKSTLMKVLCGLSEPTEGQVMADGKNINAMGTGSYRQVVACILQEDRLFSGSLKDNITGFSEHADQILMERCARSAHIHEDILALPMGYETLIGELGEGLSGGQRQRIFIARALYRRPRILFMDEATSHLDEKNEQLINQAIAALDITRVIIAHRSSTIESADRVISLGSAVQTKT